MVRISYPHVSCTVCIMFFIYINNTLCLFQLFKKLYLQENLNWSEFQLVDRLSDYLDKCVEITWLMSVHDPPMRFILSRRDEQIDLSRFMYFRVKGKVTDFTVWPAMVLYHGGPVIRHGHVIPKRTTK